jgi:hypothetical protein
LKELVPDESDYAPAIQGQRKRQEKAITAIKQARSAPVQEPVALQMDVIVVNLVREGINKHRARELAEHFIKHTTPPAAQRQWVGLTDDELNNFLKAVWGREVTPKHFIQAIEAKLKEKNHVN